MFANARNVVIGGGTSIVNSHEAKGLQLLHQKIAHGAIHDSAERFPPPRCHPTTRRTIVGELMGWVNHASRTSDVVWTNGAAGAGKTSIAQTICECLLRTGQLGGSFFFSRTAHGRNSPIYLFATIAYQLALGIPHIGGKIDKIVAQDPSVLDKSMEVQFQKLILEPLRTCEDLPTQPIVIVIDGLDECEGEDMQSQVLKLIGSALDDKTLPICFIITSRPEPWIRDEFNAGSLSSTTHHISLEQSPETDADIRSFLRERFAEILENPKHRFTMANIAKPWPTDKILDHLVEKASGQFIYAATVLKFVDDPEHRPTDRLDIVVSISTIDSPNPGPLADLDRLYIQILSSAPDKERTLDVLGAIIAQREAGRDLSLEWGLQQDSLRVAEKLLDLQEDDGYLALRTLHSLVNVSEPAIGIRDEEIAPPEGLHEYVSRDDAVRFHHKSFIDFLLDASRSGEYWIDIQEVHARLALPCLRTLENLSSIQPSRIDYVTWGYALLHWTGHCTLSGPPQGKLIDELKTFDLLRCYIETVEHQLNPQIMNDVRRLAFPPKTIFQQIQEKILGEDTTSTGTFPDPRDVQRAREFMTNIGAHNDMARSGYGQRLQRLISWLSTSADPPRKFWTQCQIVANAVRSRSNNHRRAGDPKLPDAFFLNGTPARPSFSLFRRSSKSSHAPTRA